jgi:hypothetical protein
VAVGVVVGVFVGVLVGVFDGALVGAFVGAFVGALLGAFVGAFVGADVGPAVGSATTWAVVKIANTYVTLAVNDTALAIGENVSVWPLTTAGPSNPTQPSDVAVGSNSAAYTLVPVGTVTFAGNVNVNVGVDANERLPLVRNVT